MPRYYFNVHGETFAAPDLIGRKLPDDEAARAEAELLAREVATSEHAESPFPDRPWVEVVDEDQRPVLLLPVESEPSQPSRGA